MKKLLSILIIAGFSILSFTSCNKDYECKCYLNNVEVGSSSVRAKSKNKAEDECNQKATTFGITHECKIVK